MGLPARGRARLPGRWPVSEPNGNLLTADQVAELLNVPTSWVYAETRAGRLPHVKLGRYRRYNRPSIEAFVAGLERGPVPYRKYVAPGSEPGGSPHD
jgi:excisionase family DNA binding protein